MTTDTQETINIETLPTLVHRIKALVLDFIIILVIFTLSSLILGEMQGAAVYVKGGILIFCLLIYEPLLVATRGATLGHSMMGLRIKQVSHLNKNINFLYAMLRVVFKFLLGWLSLITVLTNKHKRAVHDMLSGAIVLKK